jgi:hypothetical protein
MSGQLYLVDPQAALGIRLLTPANGGVANSGFSERQRAELIVRGSGPFQLFVDDAPLPQSTVRGEDGWTWKPGFYAGTVRVELVDSTDSQVQQYLFDVAPAPGKLGQDTFKMLLDDIIAFDPAWIFGDEPATHALGGPGNIDSIGIQYAHLFQYGKDLLRALKGVTEHPRRALIAARHTVPVSRIRRADLQTALGMARNGSLAALKIDEDELHQRSQNDWRFDVPFSVESLDCAATRCVAALTRAVLRRACSVFEILEARAMSEEESDTHTLLRDRWPRRREYLRALIGALKALLAGEPFLSVRQERPTAAGLTAVAADPIYARVQRIVWKILRPDTIGPLADSRAWMSPTWDLYETWCFIRLVQALQEVLPSLAWTRKRDSSCLQGVNGNKCVRLLWQQTFRYSSANSAAPEFSSISKELRPDFVITLDNGVSTCWLVLDAKYSAGPAILEHMRAAHVYHDALRRWDKPPMRSLLLLPAHGQECDWLREHAFQAAHGVGVVTCSPNLPTRGAFLDTIRQLVQLADLDADPKALHS